MKKGMDKKGRKQVIGGILVITGVMIGVGGAMALDTWLPSSKTLEYILSTCLVVFIIGSLTSGMLLMKETIRDILGTYR